MVVVFFPMPRQRHQNGGKKKKSASTCSEKLVKNTSEDAICAICATSPIEILLTDRFDSKPASQASQAHSSRRW